MKEVLLKPQLVTTEARISRNAAGGKGVADILGGEVAAVKPEPGILERSSLPANGLLKIDGEPQIQQSRAGGARGCPTGCVAQQIGNRLCGQHYSVCLHFGSMWLLGLPEVVEEMQTGEQV